MTLEAVPGARPSEKPCHKVQQEYRILAEYKMLQSENLSGLYTIPSHASPLEWFGVLFVRDGVFKGGIFRFKIILSESFPDESTTVPELIFDHPPFHPLVATSGHLNTVDAFANSWNPHEHHLWQLLKYAQYVFETPEVCLRSVTVHDKDAQINREAMELLEEHRQGFDERARQSVTASKENLYLKPAKEDKHYIVFEKFDSDVHGQVLDGIKARMDVSISSPPTSGLSWVNNDGGYKKPLSKPEEYQ